MTLVPAVAEKNINTVTVECNICKPPFEKNYSHNYSPLVHLSRYHVGTIGGKWERSF